MSTFVTSRFRKPIGRFAENPPRLLASLCVPQVAAHLGRKCRDSSVQSLSQTRDDRATFLNECERLSRDIGASRDYGLPVRVPRQRAANGS